MSKQLTQNYYCDLHQNETVCLFIRQHPVVIFRWSLSFLLMLVLPPFVYWFIYEMVYSSLVSYALPILWVVWYLVAIGFILERFLVWYFNIYIVTNKRVIDIDVQNFFSRRIADTTLENIQDVTFESRGLSALIFNIGDVHIQTAGKIPNLSFLRVGCPAKVHDLINDQVNQRKFRHAPH